MHNLESMRCRAPGCTAKLEWPADETVTVSGWYGDFRVVALAPGRTRITNAACPAHRPSAREEALVAELEDLGLAIGHARAAAALEGPDAPLDPAKTAQGIAALMRRFEAVEAAIAEVRGF